MPIRLSLLAVLTLCTLTVSAGIAAAQDKSAPLPGNPILVAPSYPDVLPFSKVACMNYEEKVDAIYKGQHATNFMIPVRLLYTRCPYYDPYGDDTLREMLKLVEAAKGDDPMAAVDAMKDYKALVRKHLGNLDVVKMALQISKDDSRFGNPDFFRDVRKMITGSLEDVNHTGLDLNKPIQITTFAEQNYMVAKQKGRVENNEIVETGGAYYNIYDFIGPDKKNFSLFLDITYPVLAMKNRKEEEEKKKKLNLNIQ
ncbi:MAG: hypothetical protein KDI61_08600 [Alphaproteobacteria bacterium]|nr:hypothetical protein [Alphaproteobacteria bacterium]MCB1840304.1 hypothetical protein [Alphaproteobacteria bacterium]